jgi:beta-glucosidase/6-phospho-beta-glucosidase/beta-galactosidase
MQRESYFIHFYAGKVGIALNGEWYEPTTDSQEDKQAAEMAMQFVVSALSSCSGKF